MVAVVAPVVVAAAAPSPARAQARTASGVIVDGKTGAPIADAIVAAGAGEPAVTGEDGRFALPAPGGRVEVLVQAAGYVDETLTLVSGRETRVALRPAGAAEVIELEGTAPDLGVPATWTIGGDEVRALPGAGNDALKAVQSLPGAARIPYGLGGLVMRGLAPRDTNVYLDGIEVPLAFHFGGLTSFYPSTLLSSLELTTGGFDVQHGRGQGGLVAIASRPGRTDGWRAGGELSLIDASARAEGPIGGGTISLGVRRSYLDAVLAAVLDPEDQVLPRYYDAQLRWDAGDVRRGAWTAWAFTSSDRIATENEAFTSAFWRVAARYRRQVGSLLVSVTPWAGRDELSFEELDGDDAELSRTSLPVGLRASATRDATWGHVAGGLDLQGARYGRLAFEAGGMDISQPDLDTWDADVGLWVEWRYRVLGDRLAVKPGLRVERYGLSDEWVIDPRLLVTSRVTPAVTLRGALGLYHQPPTFADQDPDFGNPALASSFTVQSSVGVDVDAPGGVKFGATAFFTQGWHIPTAIVPPPDSPFEPTDGPESGLGAVLQELLEEQLGSFEYRGNVGRARTWGVEIGAKRNVGRFLGWISYTLSQARRQDDPARFRGWRPYALDQLHNLSLVGSVTLGKWQLGARFRAVTGNPHTPVTRELDPQTGEPIGVEGAPLSRRLPLFVQLDLRADRRWQRPWGTMKLFVDVLNATNRANVEDIFYEDDGTPEALPGFPFFPFIGVEYVPLP